MAIARLALANPRVFLFGLGVGSVLIASGFMLALMATGQAGATHAGGSTLHACVSRYTGAIRMGYPGQPPNCNSGEFQVELGSGGAVADLEAELGEHEARLRTLEAAPDIASRIYYVEVDRIVEATAVATAQSCLDENDLVLSGGFSVTGPDGSRVTQRFGYPDHRDGLTDGWWNAYRFTAGADITITEYVVCLAVD